MNLRLHADRRRRPGPDGCLPGTPVLLRKGECFTPSKPGDKAEEGT